MVARAVNAGVIEPELSANTFSHVLETDWTPRTLESLSAFITKGSTPTTYGFKWEASGVLFLRSECVSENGLDLDQAMRISSAAHATLRRSEVQSGDILITITGNVGRAVFFNKAEPANINQHIARVRVIDKNVDSRYILHWLSQPSVRSHFASITTGQAYPQISLKQVREFSLRLPAKMAEQVAIADALSDADALIESLEALVAKKRAIKQGTMQELLSGQRRLPGHTKPWATSPLGSVCRSIVDGTHFTPTYVESGIPFYSVENVTADDFVNTKFISPEEHRVLVRRCKPERGDILLTRIGAIGDTKLIDWDVDASIYVSLALLKCGDGIEPAFLHAYTKSKKFVRDLEERSLLNAAPRKINMGEIGKVPIPLPEPDEQKAIAEVLDAMDAELVALDSKLKGARQIKQGMMQDLLTGRVRLV